MKSSIFVFRARDAAIFLLFFLLVAKSCASEFASSQPESNASDETTNKSCFDTNSRYEFQTRSNSLDDNMPFELPLLIDPDCKEIKEVRTNHMMHVSLIAVAESKIDLLEKEPSAKFRAMSPEERRTVLNKYKDDLEEAFMVLGAGPDSPIRQIILLPHAMAIINPEGRPVMVMPSALQRVIAMLKGNLENSKAIVRPIWNELEMDFGFDDEE